MPFLSKSTLQKKRPAFTPSPKRSAPMKVVSSKRAPSLPVIPESSRVSDASPSNIAVFSKVPSLTETPGCSTSIRDPSSAKIKGILKKPITSWSWNRGELSGSAADAATIIAESTLQNGSTSAPTTTTTSTSRDLIPIIPSDKSIIELIDLCGDDEFPPLPYSNGELFKEVNFKEPKPEANGILNEQETNRISNVQELVAETPQSGLDKDKVTPKRRGKPRKLMPISNGTTDSVKTRSASKEANGIIGTDNGTAQIKKRRRPRRRCHYSLTPKKLKNEATSLTFHEKSLNLLQKEIRKVGAKKICLADKIRSLEEIENTLSQKHLEAVRSLVIQGTGPKADNRAHRMDKISMKIENMIVSLQHSISQKVKQRETDQANLLAQSNKRSTNAFCCKFCLEGRNRQLSNHQ